MLNLYVMRHSKSSWNDHGLSDFKRPLSVRGYRDVKVVISFLKKKKIQFDLAYISSSQRTKETLKILNSKIKIRKKIFSKKFYLCSEDLIIEILKKTKQKYKNIIIINHEPCCKNLILKLIQKKILLKNKKFYTSSVACLKFNIKNWKNIKKSTGKLTLFKSPKDLI